MSLAFLTQEMLVNAQAVAEMVGNFATSAMGKDGSMMTHVAIAQVANTHAQNVTARVRVGNHR